MKIIKRIICWCVGHKRTYEGAVYIKPYTGYGKYYCYRCGIDLPCLHKDHCGDSYEIIKRMLKYPFREISHTDVIYQDNVCVLKKCRICGQEELFDYDYFGNEQIYRR